MNARIATMEQQMLALISSVFDAYTVVLFLPRQQGEAEEAECRLTAYYSQGDSVRPDTVVRPGQDLVGWILANGQPLQVSSFQEHGKLIYYGDAEEAGIKAFMGCPVPGGGVLCVDTKRQQEFNEKEHKQLHMFAALLSGVYAAASEESMLGDIPRFFSRLETLDDLRLHYKTWDTFIASFLRIVADAARFDYAAFVSVEVPDESYSISAENKPVLVVGREPFYQSINAGLAGWVLRNGQPIVQTGEEGRVPALFGVSSNLPEFAAVAVFPVVINKTVRACVCFGHTEVHPVNQSMRTFFREAVSLLAVHSENLYLRMRLRKSMDMAQIYTRAPRMHSQNVAFAQSATEDKK
ncbi:MAG: GAF domain-containing protein [Desulfovibrionaceae bacterium]|nr:GAF domain-containing protein [Desulfovibrionaceae bacterium]